MTKLEAWIQAANLIKPIIGNYSIKEIRGPSNIFGNTGAVTPVEQYINHIMSVAEWLLEEDKAGEETFVTSVLEVENEEESATRLEKLTAAVGRAWTHPETASKEMDVEIAEAIIDEVLPLLVKAEDEKDEPKLGIATTQTLLSELATRMEITQDTEVGAALGLVLREALENLDQDVLDYRTWQGPYTERVE
jgi:hypothetical protein